MPEPPVRPPIIDSLSPAFVAACLQSAENSAPGPDLISYRHWREIDPSCKILCKIFNICIRLSDIPTSWKTSKTVLIHKKGDTGDIKNWRLISLSDTIYKLFTKCLTKKVNDWCEDHEVLSPAQKGFTPHDGVLEHNFLIAQHMEEARRLKKDKYLAWLDISNAFGSVPRQVIIDALVSVGADQDFITLVFNIYEDSTTQVLTEEGPTAPIALQSGVKQGCPLSGILFNIAIDQVLRSVQEDRSHRAVLAFADDLVLLADSAEEMQEMLQTTDEELRALCMHLNPNKCATLHLSGRTPVQAIPTVFKIRETGITALRDGESATYLGKPVGFFLRKTFGSVNEALTLLERISSSNLTQWQKIDAIKSFFFPSLSFAMRTAQIGKTSWTEVDVAARQELKNILSLPTNASNQYLHGNRKLGGCGIPSAAEDSDFYLVDSAFKLLTSKDEDVALQALGQLTRTVRHRVRRQPTDGDMGSYMSGCMDDEFAESTNRLTNTWTLARQASKRAQVTWTFTEGLPSLTIADDCLTATKSRGVMKAFHDNFQLQESSKLLENPSQGKAMDCVALSPASTHFLLDGKYTRFADWKFVHKARLNLVALNGSKHWLPKERRACRKCGQGEENRQIHPSPEPLRLTWVRGGTDCANSCRFSGCLGPGERQIPEHLTGAQQYTIGAPTVEDLPATPERRQDIAQRSERNEESPQGDATIASPIEPISPEIEVGANSPPIRRGVNQRRTCTNLSHLSVSSVNIPVMYSVFMLCYASGETVFPTYLCFVCLQCHC
ncbi:retrovirus-related Pol polyprotein from type-1 retrotransposable element R2 [Trichonephila clavata]|uniref:Retrovirus-related Pol polyprotein from type-1 retrotransposable element R2 n=1 Tax=Trichonephila clavata TaxID=2740835 RepID=A0A8X6IYS4_TRICU|nr:retrovirus-related Pol polyprotein from type-1 retrotransposable element R2 [Trichonephila clavata]